METIEDRMRAALDGKFTHYVGKPIEDIVYIRPPPKTKEEREAARLEREAEMARVELEKAKRAAERMLAEEATPPRRILGAVASAHGVKPHLIMGPTRVRRISIARNHTLWEVRERLKYSYPKIGKIFGRDHTTILSNVEWFKLHRHQYDDHVEAVERMLTTQEVMG